MSPAESIANLRRMQVIAPPTLGVDHARPGVRGPRRRVPALPVRRLDLANTDIRAFAEALQGADGLHPTPAGQSAIVRSLVTGLAALAPVRSDGTTR